MAEHDPKIDPKTANVVGHDTNQPYADRTISTIIGFIIAMLLVSAFAGWYFFSQPEGSPTERPESTLDTTSPQLPGNEYQKNSPRSGIYNFFYTMFGGIEDGLEDNPHNLKNVEEIDDFNLDNNASDPIAAELKLNQIIDIQARRYASRLEKPDDNYIHSLYDVVGSDVMGQQGKKAGAVHDIIIDKDSGLAHAVIINQDGGYYNRDLKALKFKNILKQQPDGAVKATVTEDTLEQKQEFNYGTTDDRYISLRRLRDAQILDFEGNVTGQIDAIIYENAETQNIYFNLRPVLAQHGIATLNLPFKEANIVESRDGLDIRLNKEQTEALAKMLFENE